MKWAAVAGMVVLSGCTAAQSVETTCNADNWKDLIGQPEAAVHSVLGNLRIVRPGEPITKDFNPSRLNAEIDSTGHVTRFACY
jgi:hypothetical protein